MSVFRDNPEFGLASESERPDLIFLVSYVEMPETLLLESEKINKLTAKILYEISCTFVSARLMAVPIVAIGSAFQLCHILFQRGLVYDVSPLVKPKQKLVGQEERYNNLEFFNKNNTEVDATEAKYIYDTVMATVDSRAEVVWNVQPPFMGLSFHPEIDKNNVPFFIETLYKFLTEI